MARISTYAIDAVPVSSDKLIGTDSAGAVTKNYPLGDVAYWLKSSGATAVLGQNNYTFQIALDPDQGRKIGSFSFENYGGDGTSFEDVTNLKFSASSSTGKYIADYLLSTVSQKIMLSQLDDPNSFGIYVLASLTQSSLEPAFYDATLVSVSSNGVLRGNESYGLATYSALNEAGGGTWGSIIGDIANQTDLVDYIDAEIAAIPTPPTPTLDSVTTQGATTTNAITIGGLTAASLAYPSADGTANQIIATDGSGTLSFVDLPNDATWGNITGTLSSQTDLNSALNAKEDVSNKRIDTSLGLRNTYYPSQLAVKTYVDNGLALKEDTSNKSSDVTLGGVTPSSTLYTTEYAVATYVQNEIAQAQSGIPTFEIDMFANYKLYEYDEDGATSYLGQIKATNGNWLITKFVDSSGDIAATYANASNNASYTTMATAWAARTGLTYEDINDLTSI